jgi:hypothetical protein
MRYLTLRTLFPFSVVSQSALAPHFAHALRLDLVRNHRKKNVKMKERREYEPLFTKVATHSYQDLRTIK